MATWDAGSATTATIELRNITTADIGNDFALDDLAFNGSAVNPVPEPPALALTVIGCGALLGSAAWGRLLGRAQVAQ